MSAVKQSTRNYLIMLVVGFLGIGVVFSQMDADIAVSLVGESVRGSGNHSVRSEVGGLITDVYVEEGNRIDVGAPILQLDATDVSDEIASLEAEIIGAKSVIKSKKATKAIHEKELASVERLVEKGLEPKSELRKARVELGLAEAGLIDAEGQLSVLEAHRSRLQDRLSRYQVKSSAKGQLLRLHRFARGDVLKAGDLIGEIVPEDGQLLFEAKVSPMDIASVAVGNPAKVTLRAVNRYEVKPRHGKVVYVSPASLETEQGDRYFITRIALNEDVTGPDAAMLSEVGHVADISVKSGQRSVLAFVLSPLVRGAERVFQER